MAKTTAPPPSRQGREKTTLPNLRFGREPGAPAKSKILRGESPLPSHFPIADFELSLGVVLRPRLCAKISQTAGTGDKIDQPTAANGGEEARLIQRSQQRDKESFNKLVAIYQVRIYNLSLRMLGNVPAAEDATQDAFLSAWKGIRGFRGGSFKSWLLRIAANTCYDYLRRLKRYPVVPLETVNPEPLSTRQSPEDYARHQELQKHIQQGLSLLPPEQRLAVTLCDIQELSYEEISRVMQCSPGTVRSRLSRGRAQLRAYLSQFYRDW